MTADRWRQIEDLFLQALECPPASRTSFLDQACRGDDQLKRELESLLSCDAPNQNLIQVPELSNLTLDNPDPGADLTGRHFGPYRITGVIGHGGMGSVYLGLRDDDQYRKQVAIKLLKRGMDTDFMLARFRQERQILANLEHPFIARLLDGGATDDGLPYFVMEYVDGLPISKYCRERNVSVVERLRLFRLVCEAIQHAHQNLVVHRDIKPSNILTTKEGIPKLLDFGIAKVLDPGVSTGVTMTQREQRLLTPDYASPEQVKGLPIGTASDIYSLGAVLYELLAGQRPHRFTSNSLAEMEKIICDVEPEKPSIAAGHDRQLRRRLSGDLDNIILTAMRKEPQRRYASAAEFSEDIRRHMEGLPILAREDRFTYRAAKFMLRNKLAVAAAFLLLASLVGGIVATTYQARRAERRFQLVRGLANSVLFDLHDKVQLLPGSTMARASMIETVLRYLDNLAKDRGGQDAGLQLEIAKTYHRIAAIEGHPDHPNLGRTAAARTHYQQSLEMLKTLAGQAETRVPAIEEMIYVYIETGDIELAAGNLDAAKALFQNAGNLGDSVNLSRDTETYVYFRLGDIEAQQGGAGASMPLYRKALEHAEAWAAANRSPQALRNLRRAYNRLANATRETGDLYACLNYLLKARQVVEERLRQADRNIEDRRGLMTTLLELAALQDGPDDLSLGDHDSALANYRAGLKLAQEFVSADPHDMRARRDLGLSFRRLGQFLFEDNPADAAKDYLLALEISNSMLAANPGSIDFRRDVMEDNWGLGILARNAGRYDESMQRLTRALELQKNIEAAAPYRIWLTRYITQIYTEIGHTLLASGDIKTALTNYQQALLAAERILSRAPTSLYLIRDRADVWEAIGGYFAMLSAQPGLTPARRALLKTEARSHFQKSADLWRDWTARRIGIPYSTRRETKVQAAIAKLGVP